MRLQCHDSVMGQGRNGNVKIAGFQRDRRQKVAAQPKRLKDYLKVRAIRIGRQVSIQIASAGIKEEQVSHSEVVAQFESADYTDYTENRDSQRLLICYQSSCLLRLPPVPSGIRARRIARGTRVRK
jgi:hypothetical protein